MITLVLSSGAVFDKLNGAGGYFDNGFVAANIFLNELTIKVWSWGAGLFYDATTTPLPLSKMGRPDPQSPYSL